MSFGPVAVGVGVGVGLGGSIRSSVSPSDAMRLWAARCESLERKVGEAGINEMTIDATSPLWGDWDGWRVRVVPSGEFAIAASVGSIIGRFALDTT